MPVVALEEKDRTRQRSGGTRSPFFPSRSSIIGWRLLDHPILYRNILGENGEKVRGAALPLSPNLWSRPSGTSGEADGEEEGRGIALDLGVRIWSNNGHNGCLGLYEQDTYPLSILGYPFRWMDPGEDNLKGRPPSCSRSPLPVALTCQL